MEVVVLIMTIFIWVVVGLWINHKREWYTNSGWNKDKITDLRFTNILLAPFALILAFFKEFLIKPWNNN